GCSLEYTTTLLRVTEPMEDRMEKAQFSPSLSKQRVKYGVDRIKESSATFLVDFGCGSGSLLDSHNLHIWNDFGNSRGGCSLEYTTTLLRVTEPMEDRMEKAQFSPSLSKQRVKYAVDRIKESSATFLVDFGCGSRSLLDSLLDYPTSLEIIVGVDISTKALTRAAK
nr:small RNA 2'-O-methyltransferase [Tanacetum cinerariifolium]